MKVILYWLFLTFFFCLSMEAKGQHLPHVKGQILVRIPPNTRPFPLITRFESDQPSIPLRGIAQVSETLNIWLLETIEKTELPVLRWLNRQPEVLVAQFNHLLEFRSGPHGVLPDDPLFFQQWQHLNTGAQGGIPDADLDTEEAWTISTGGLTASGDTIVIAVIDSGVDYIHEDLTPNLWRNSRETPGDNIDNDNNGYIDDYFGWNVNQSDDDIGGSGTSHGTPISAIIAAKGNNGIGVTGINWDAKLMFIAGINHEASILKAYDYVLKSRKRFNETNGQEGAFVVAVNCSWGLTYGQPAQAPLWCAAFDSLGAAGILSVAATTNTALNVDLSGDLPTACPSDYLIAVTNIDMWDKKASNAGWGLESIDLGAYGQEVFTAGTNNTYGNFSGTSFSAPQVSGAIGLLYSAPCPNLTEITRTNPAAAALWVKNQIINTTTSNNDLAGMTVSGGRLNLKSLMQSYEGQCVDCVPPFAIFARGVTNESMLLDWFVVEGMENISLRWRKAGDFFWIPIPDASAPFELTGLTGCTDYEFSMRGTCENSKLSTWSVPVTISTAGCCYPPASIEAVNITDTSAVIKWTNSDYVLGYNIRFRSVGSSDWQLINCDKNSQLITGLSPCTDYEVKIESQCTPDSTSEWETSEFLTAGCGACTDLEYCTAQGESAEDEWIKKVDIGSWTHSSNMHYGYEDFTGNTGNFLTISPGVELPVSITPGFSGLPYKEFFRIYIDYNADGDFEDSNELAFDPGFASDVAVFGVIVPPTDLSWGLTRMRIMMKYKELSGSPPSACETYEFGQVEDYCIQLGSSVQSKTKPSSIRQLLGYPQPAQNQVHLRLPESSNSTFQVVVLNTTGKIMQQKTGQLISGQFQLDVSGLPNGLFIVHLTADGNVYQYKMLIVR